MQRSLPSAFLRLCLTAVSLGGPELRGAEFFVAPTGQDDNPGTLEQPFTTIQRAHESVAPGDTVLVRGGSIRWLSSTSRRPTVAVPAWKHA